MVQGSRDPMFPINVVGSHVNAIRVGMSLIIIPHRTNRHDQMIVQEVYRILAHQLNVPLQLHMLGLMGRRQWMR